MKTTTHPLPYVHTGAAMALAEELGATLVVNDPTYVNHVSEVARPNVPQTATWYVEDDVLAAVDAGLAEIGITGLVWEAVDTTVDYVAATAHLFAPLRVGRFYITRNFEEPPEGCLAIQIPPNQAFGSGEHATTSGCLRALEWWCTVGDMKPTHALDFGAGSAILALATAKMLGISVVCADNEEPAVRIALENAATNGVAPLISSFWADTPAQPDVMARAPYPLVFANILLGPLVRLDEPLKTVVGMGGYLILSGFTTDQEVDITAAYADMTVVQRHVDGMWVTLTLLKPTRTPSILVS
ncbi:MAG: 50S ribosomal protein L11 methyltransferase [Alphaproteobacteria bacterium]